MKMTHPSISSLQRGIVLAGLLLASHGHAAQPVVGNAELPDTVRPGYVGPVVGPANDLAYAHGTLGLIRPGYGRASLFVAWRVIHLPVGAVANESHRRRGNWLHGGPAPVSGGDQIASWLQARSTLVPSAPAVAPVYFRIGKLSAAGLGDIEVQIGECGADAYALATRTLLELEADASLSDADRKGWLAGQDAVFARCGWTPGTGQAPELPAPVPPNAPQRLKALNAYQHAAALFYGDDFVAAGREFDAIALVPNHPMRAWATLAALRCIVRDAVRDAEWDAAFGDAWSRRGLRGAELSAAIAGPSARHRARVDAALKSYDSRTRSAKADPSLATIFPAIDYTTRRMVLQLAPRVPILQTMNALDRAEYNPYDMGVLDLFQQLYPLVATDRPEGPAAVAMRRHAWFDFIVSVQGCGDGSLASSPNVCDEEHAHATARWQETKDNAWLLAALMTARAPSAEDLPAAYAARAVPADRPEWASAQLYAAHVLRIQGRRDDARATLDALTTSTAIALRDRPLIEAERRAL